MSVIEEKQNKAAEERLWSYTVGIANGAVTTRGTDPVTGLKGKEEESPGTGVAGVWCNRHFILTAKHVVEAAHVRDLRFFIRRVGELKSKRVSEVRLQDGCEPVQLADPNATIHRCEFADLAVVTMTQAALGPMLEFFDAATSWHDPSEGERVFGVGYPVSFGVEVDRRRIGSELQRSIVLSPVGFNGIVQPSASGRYFGDFDPQRDFLIPYEHGKEGKHPKGISGAAVWVQSNGVHQVWAARYRFAGICTSCYRDGTVEQIVKASVVRQFLTKVFGALNS
jgi:hypothetical protein